MNLIYFIPPLLLLTYVTYRNLRYGLYIVLATVPAFLLRTQIWFVPTTWLELSIYTVAAVTFYKHLKQQTFVSHLFDTVRHVKVYIIPFLLLFVALLVSTLISDNKFRALGVLKQWFFAPVLFTLLLLHYTKTKHQLIKVLFAISLSAWPIIIYGLYEYVTGVGMTITGRLDSFFTSPNYVTMYLVPLFVLILGFVIVGGLSGRYFIIWLCFTLLAILLTRSFGGLFGLIGGVGFMSLFVRHFTIKKAFIFFCSLFVLAFSFFYVSSKTQFSHESRFWNINSFQTRIEIWTHSLVMLSQHPFLGLGLADFQNDYNVYIEALPKDKQPVEKEVLFPHNLVLNLWLETGLLGLVAFIWLIVIFYHSFWLLYHSLNKEPLTIAPVSAMSVILLHGLVDTPYFKNDLSLLFWFIFGVYVILWQICQNFRNIKG